MAFGCRTYAIGPSTSGSLGPSARQVNQNMDELPNQCVYFALRRDIHPPLLYAHQTGHQLQHQQQSRLVCHSQACSGRQSGLLCHCIIFCCGTILLHLLSSPLHLHWLLPQGWQGRTLLCWLWLQPPPYPLPNNLYSDI